MTLELERQGSLLLEALRIRREEFDKEHKKWMQRNGINEYVLEEGQVYLSQSFKYAIEILIIEGETVLYKFADKVEGKETEVEDTVSNITTMIEKWKQIGNWR